MLVRVTRNCLLAVLVAVLSFWSTDDGTESICRLVPDVSESTIWHLVHSDDNALAAYGLDHGFFRLGADIWGLTKAFLVSSDTLAARIDPIVTPLVARFPEILREYPGNSHLREYADRWCALSPHEKRIVAGLVDRGARTINDPVLTVDDRENEYRRLLDEYRAYPRLIDPGDVYLAYVSLLVNNRRGDEVPALIEEAIARTLADDHHLSACNLLGMKGSGWFARDEPDSAVAVYYDGVKLARHCRPDQEARLLSFIGHRYFRAGRFTLAHELYRSAEEISQRPGARGSGIRHYLNVLLMHAELGCWDIVGADLERYPVMERDLRKYVPGDDVTWPDRVELVRARHLAATGDIDNAERLFEQLRDRTAQRPQQGDIELVLLAWGRALIDRGRFSEARPLVEDGIERSERRPAGLLASGFRLAQARIALGEGALDACGVALDAAVRARSSWTGHEDELIDHDLIQAQLAVARGDESMVEYWLRSAINRLRAVLDNVEVAAPGYLAADNANMLSLLRSRTRGDVMAGFALELTWPRATERNGRSNVHPLSSCLNIVTNGSGWRDPVERHLARLEDGDATHLVYAGYHAGVVRWTAYGSVLACDTVAVSPARLKDLVARARLEILSNAPAGDALRQLSDLLLPSVLREPGGRAGTLVLVSVAGVLSDLPFEALSVRRDRYVPLLEEHDVAYLRGIPRQHRAPASAPGLVIADPIAAPIVARRYPGLATRLDHGIREAERLARYDPAVTVLSRESASKPAVMQRWENARYLYFAAHALRDPDLPYLSFIPMSSDPNDVRYESLFVDVGDIRSSDLSGCDLVVLSGCETGSGYQDSRVRGPALADAFLDAGCGAVVQTFWAVDDEAAATLMGRFVDAWLGERMTPSRAINEARQRALATGAEPALWAGYSIILN